MSVGVMKLGDIANLSTGKLDSNAATEGGAYPFFTCDPTTLAIDNYAFDTEAVLLAGNNASGNFTAKYFKGKFNAYQRTYVITTKDCDVLLTSYLHYALNMSLLSLKSQSAGSTTKYLTKTILNSLPIPVPSIESQQRIVEILSSFDNLIENNRRQIALLEEATALAYVEWSARMDVDSAINGVASDFFDITIGKTPPRSHTECFASEGVPWASVKDLGDAGGPYLRVTSECLTEQAAQQYKVKIKPTGTIVLSFKLTIGRVAILNQPSATNEAIAHFVTDDDAVKLYTYEYLKHFDYESLGSTSSIGKAINSKIVKALPFVMPCRYDLDCLYEILNPIFENMKLCQTRIELAREARDRLLPALMSGEIEV